MAKKTIQIKMAFSTYSRESGGLELEGCTPQYIVLWTLNDSSTIAIMLIIDKVVQMANPAMLGRRDFLPFASANSASDADFDSDLE